MYLPPHFALTDLDEIIRQVESIGAVDLITASQTGPPQATLLPVIWDRREWSPENGDFGALRMHMARGNQHWKSIADGTLALAIVHGPQAYVSPSAYESKREHGKVVPTWNYLSIHVEGELYVSNDVEQLRHSVDTLTDFHETKREHPWHMSDAPESYIESQLRAIVGITLKITKLSGKAKLSQNRPGPDRIGVVQDLRQSKDVSANQIAELMNKTLL